MTWARVDPARRAAVVEAAEAEFGAHGFSRGSLNVIARRAGVAKGSLFQYFADKRDLYAFIADIASQRVPLLHGGPDPRAGPEPAVLRIPHRPARWLGRLLRRASSGTCVACCGDPGGRHRCPHQRAQRPAPPLPGRATAAGARRARAGRPARRFRHRCIDVAAAADLSAPGAGSIHAWFGSDPGPRRAHT
ncbi:putative transcriptional regulatory protein [Mycobacterium tuberculosis RGTB327]|nr:putative transcriptional regulatory protein [Mycobacterium tuberculosis RGTB327]